MCAPFNGCSQELSRLLLGAGLKLILLDSRLYQARDRLARLHLISEPSQRGSVLAEFVQARILAVTERRTKGDMGDTPPRGGHRRRWSHDGVDRSHSNISCMHSTVDDATATVQLPFSVPLARQGRLPPAPWSLVGSIADSC